MLENSYSPLRVFTGSLLLLLSQQSSHCLSNFSVEFIIVGYLDMANTFWVSLCPVKLNKTCTSCLWLSSHFSIFLCTYFPYELSFLAKAWLQSQGKSFSRAVHFPIALIWTNSFKDRLLICLFPRTNFGGWCIPEAGSEFSFSGRAWDTSVNVFILWLFRSERQDLEGHDPGGKECPISCPWLAQGGGVCKIQLLWGFCDMMGDRLDGWRVQVQSWLVVVSVYSVRSRTLK